MTDEQPVPPSVPEPQAAAPVAAPEVSAAPAPMPTEAQPIVTEISEATPEDVLEMVAEQAGETQKAPEAPVAAPAPVQSAPPPQANVPKASAGPHMRAAARAKKQARLEKVMEIAAAKRVITNNDVQHALNVSDATATRYLSELVKTGRLKRSGVRGGVIYEAL